MSTISKAGRGASLRKPSVRVVAGTVVAAVAASSFAFSGASAGAASLPNSQSVGRFVDGSLGTTPIQSIANVKDARAVNPGSTSVQNPLDVTLLNALTLPLTGSLQLPQLLGINLGAANQVAVAKSDGFSYGGSGAVSNSGGVSVGGNNAAFPADATINLSGSGIAGNAGAGADALGAVKVTIGAVSALASTPAGVGKPGATQYQVAGLTIDAGSPLLGKLLATVGSTLSGILDTLVTTIGKLANIPAGCSVLNGSLPSLSLDGGAVVLDPNTGGLVFDLGKLLQVLGLDLNNLPANTDLVKLLVQYITDPAGLAKGLEGLVNGLTQPLVDIFTSCKAALNAIPVLGPVLVTLVDTLTSGQTTLENTINGIVDTIAGKVGTNPLGPLADIITKLVDIGVNVQPNGAAGTYSDKLKATPAQDTPVVAGQTVVRAIEVNVLGNAVNLALANAAAGPSNPTVAPPTTAPPTTAPPTGVPAGHGPTGGSPTLPLVLLLLGLMTAGSGVLAQRLRVRRSH